MSAIKSAIVGAIAIGVLAIGVGNATASPLVESAFKASTSNFAVSGGSGQVAAGIKCEQAGFNGVLSGGQATANELTFTNCVNNFWGKAIVTAANPWTLTFAKGANGTEVTTFGGLNLRVKLTQLPDCSYDMFGKATSTTPSSTISSWPITPGSGVGTMIVRYPTAQCPSLGIREINGVGGWVTANFAVTPTIKVG